MQAILGTVALVSLFLVLAASAAPGVLALWGRARGRERELEMWQMMRRRGLAADDGSARAADMARAIRRCTLCPSVESCRRWLASGRAEGADDFCPNDRFFAALESAQHR
jgi:hypothetical protein